MQDLIGFVPSLLKHHVLGNVLLELAWLLVELFVQSFCSVGGFQQCLRISWSQTQSRVPGGVRNDRGFAR